LGLGLLFCGIMGAAANMFFAFAGRKTENIQQYGIYCAGLILLYAGGCFIASHRGMPQDLHGQIYYEYLFWDGGHILQFVHTQLLLVSWLWLAGASGLTLKIGERIVRLFYLFGPLAVSYWVLYIFFKFPDIMSDEHRSAFTLMMRDMNALAPLVIGGFILLEFVLPSRTALPANPEAKLAKAALFMSILLFMAGGVLGYLIAGSNVTVPAHYHGSIVGVTLAFMGVAYLLLPAFGWADISQSRLAFWQPVIYGGGQLCWMVGMAMLGARGVPRKTPGSADTMGTLAAFLKHGGDGLALIGGLLFVYVVIRAIYKRPKEV
jgi:hypothetical protein